MATFVKGKLKADRLEYLIPDAWLEFSSVGDWPSDVYAGRLSVLGERVRLEDLPEKKS